MPKPLALLGSGVLSLVSVVEGPPRNSLVLPVLFDETFDSPYHLEPGIDDNEKARRSDLVQAFRNFADTQSVASQGLDYVAIPVGIGYIMARGKSQFGTVSRFNHSRNAVESVPFWAFLIWRLFQKSGDKLEYVADTVSVHTSAMAARACAKGYVEASGLDEAGKMNFNLRPVMTFYKPEKGAQRLGISGFVNNNCETVFMIKGQERDDGYQKAVALLKPIN